LIANLLAIKEEIGKELDSTKVKFLKLLKSLRTKISIKGERNLFDKVTNNNNVL
jgi:hypothetical protein